jgi:hypothetical protein
MNYYLVVVYIYPAQPELVGDTKAEPDYSTLLAA